ncbi:hypothetical protein WL05_03230 [Burkholderia ubonensis]|uniref:hypothetical protein n=1 Tax=Burkholderia ubonensis TaxID=101571 RepID=UPI0007557E48|nr:hypothetical protein [Burkholderia ubonensis]KVM04127.1 hypothetical protein WJ52_30465 [Burkholderia ubonensis]KVM17112.1 hypothetical protein WJ51_00485 [Burkholderia ubonensis]KVM56926.1 hypothetical protein WJ56_02395 [Burkholderia ubonensis]KVU47975.1 hypothetical protein WK69_12095 [Burkholderia ubonensis]KVX59809.1 hypothetical protein WL05_03230 [Burkholderia ubonensis]
MNADGNPGNAVSPTNSPVERIRTELEKLNPSTKRRILEKFALAALGSIPWVGGFISALASVKTEESGLRTSSLQTQWLEQHQSKMETLSATMQEIGRRFEAIGEEIDERLASEEYLDIVRKAFRAWDKADTEEKRRYVANLVTNAAGTRLCSDDVVRLFIDWLDSYHESHLAVIREIFKNPGSTRFDIWSVIYGDLVREDSAEADLYKLLIRDLSTGGVIRQERDTNADGQFLRKQISRKPQGPSTATVVSAFEGSKQYVLTELGRQFVHYSMNEVVQRVSGA